MPRPSLLLAVRHAALSFALVQQVVWVWPLQGLEACPQQTSSDEQRLAEKEEEAQPLLLALAVDVAVAVAPVRVMAQEGALAEFDATYVAVDATYVAVAVDATFVPQEGALAE